MQHVWSVKSGMGRTGHGHTAAKRRCRAAAGLVLTLALVGACGFGNGGGSTADTTAPLVVAVPSLGTQQWAPWTVQPDEEFISYLVGDTLVEVDPDSGDLRPGLAASWEVSSDLRTWTFTLRPDVSFHGDWGTVTAEDVKFSWEQIIREDSTSGLSGPLRQAVGDDIDNLQVVNELTFTVTATEAVPILPTQLANQASGLVVQSKRYWDEVGADEAAASPIGTGPFTFVSSTTGVEVKLRATESHPFRTTPSFEDVEIRVIGDESTRLAAVQSGEVDLTIISPLQVEEAESAQLRLISIPNFGLANAIFGGMYPEHPNYDSDAPWIQADNPEQGLAIRQALSYAIDRQAIIDFVYGGQGEPVACPLVCFPGMPWTDTSIPLPEYDPDRARDLLAAGGYPDGFSVEMPLIEQNGRPGTADAAEAIAGMWEDIGLDIERQPMDQATFVPLVQERATAGMLHQYVTPFYADPAIGVRIAYSTTSLNSMFNDPAIESALAELALEAGTEARYEIVSEMSRQLVDNMSAIPLFSQPSLYVARDRVGEWTPLTGLSQSRLETVTPGQE